MRRTGDWISAEVLRTQSAYTRRTSGIQNAAFARNRASDYCGDLVLGEFGAIMQDTIAKYGAGALVVKPDSPEFTDYLYWFHFATV